jgi:hypothetical protein
LFTETIDALVAVRILRGEIAGRDADQSEFGEEFCFCDQGCGGAVAGPSTMDESEAVVVPSIREGFGTAPSGELPPVAMREQHESRGKRPWTTENRRRRFSFSC